MNLKFLITSEIFTIFVLVANAKIPSLLYPKPGSNVKMIIGFGIPWDNLVVETITSGMVWRIHFRLPASIKDLKHRTVTKLGRQLDGLIQADNEEQLTNNSTIGERNRPELQKYFQSSYRWGVYSSLEGVAKIMGLNGRECILKSICEAAEEPFHFGNGLWAELMHILLRPSSSVDKLSVHSDNEYYHAEHVGRTGAGCHQVFRNCPRSLLDHFSNFYKLTDDFRSIF